MVSTPTPLHYLRIFFPFLFFAVNFILTTHKYAIIPQILCREKRTTQFSPLHCLHIPFMFFPYSKFLKKFVCLYCLQFFFAHFFLKLLQWLLPFSTSLHKNIYFKVINDLLTAVSIGQYPVLLFSSFCFFFPVCEFSVFLTNFFFIVLLHVLVLECPSLILGPFLLLFSLILPAVSELILALNTISIWQQLNFYLQPRSISIAYLTSPPGYLIHASSSALPDLNSLSLPPYLLNNINLSHFCCWKHCLSICSGWKPWNSFVPFLATHFLYQKLCWCFQLIFRIQPLLTISTTSTLACTTISVILYMGYWSNAERSSCMYLALDSLILTEEWSL